jgi:hypothetical protein
VKLTGLEPRSYLGIKLTGAAEVEAAGGRVAPVLLEAGTYSVTVTSLPSLYFVVVVFATIPCGTATLGGGRGGRDEAVEGSELDTGYAVADTTGMSLSLNGGADGSASFGFASVMAEDDTGNEK